MRKRWGQWESPDTEPPVALQAAVLLALLWAIWVLL